MPTEVVYVDSEGFSAEVSKLVRKGYSCIEDRYAAVCLKRYDHEVYHVKVLVRREG